MEGDDASRLLSSAPRKEVTKVLALDNGNRMERGGIRDEEDNIKMGFVGARTAVTCVQRMVRCTAAWAFCRAQHHTDFIQKCARTLPAAFLLLNICRLLVVVHRDPEHTHS